MVDIAGLKISYNMKEGPANPIGVWHYDVALRSFRHLGSLI
jgi:hypothetical protein